MCHTRVLECGLARYLKLALQLIVAKLDAFKLRLIRKDHDPSGSKHASRAYTPAQLMPFPTAYDTSLHAVSVPVRFRTFTLEFAGLSGLVAVSRCSRSYTSREITSFMAAVYRL